MTGRKVEARQTPAIRREIEGRGRRKAEESEKRVPGRREGNERAINEVERRKC